MRNSEGWSSLKEFPKKYNFFLALINVHILVENFSILCSNPWLTFCCSVVYSEVEWCLFLAYKSLVVILHSLKSIYYLSPSVLNKAISNMGKTNSAHHLSCEGAIFSDQVLHQPSLELEPWKQDILTDSEWRGVRGTNINKNESEYDEWETKITFKD